MFGTYRTILALAVVVHHLLIIPIIGHYAVQGFFVLSGYLMTLIMHKTYHYSPKGLMLFSFNRFLRLFPVYWVIILASLFLILLVGEANSVIYRNSMYFPDSFSLWLQNFSMVYLDFFPGEVSPRISPPTWALTVELFFYLLIALGVSKSAFATLLWLLISFSYVICTFAFGLSYEYRYSSVLAGSLPFSVGALIYHYYSALIKFMPFHKSKFLGIFLIASFFLNVVFGILLVLSGNFPTLEYFSFYLNVLINALIVLFLIKGAIPVVSFEIDKKIGDYSYPIYLMHWQVGLLSSMIIWGAPVRGASFEGFLSFFLSVIICFIFSYFLIKMVDQRIETVRASIRNRSE
ncbi:acyltransferase [Marinobacter sp. S6332]|uniref:acyltransferase family protein n=1 Tax=Marinobacter sp. S6332 TaxID=2926403 RepID=UPI001FF12E50|nr:acyltransferase [Marinobacter sp. S6332]MCK0163984.1 acyltransferase [Marinobacter sp. S6332]